MMLLVNERAGQRKAQGQKKTKTRKKEKKNA